jgi:hypothetical protein
MIQLYGEWTVIICISKAFMRLNMVVDGQAENERGLNSYLHLGTKAIGRSIVGLDDQCCGGFYNVTRMPWHVKLNKLLHFPLLFCCLAV